MQEIWRQFQEFEIVSKDPKGFEDRFEENRRALKQFEELLLMKGFGEVWRYFKGFERSLKTFESIWWYLKGFE